MAEPAFTTQCGSADLTTSHGQAVRRLHRGPCSRGYPSEAALAVSYRKSLIRDLIPRKIDRLLDVGSGPIFPDYTYADRARSILCVDWNMVTIGEVPAHIEARGGDFVRMDLPQEAFDVAVAADVFEHVQIEDEQAFIDKCVACLKPGGKLIVSVPNRGTFAWLDPYQMKPLRDLILSKVGLFKGVHNGGCDIRKGHKHYRIEDLKRQFGLQLETVRYYGFFYDPLLTWAYAVLGEESKNPLVEWLERRVEAEFGRDYGVRSFNMVAVFKKATSQAAA